MQYRKCWSAVHDLLGPFSLVGCIGLCQSTFLYSMLSL